jgi:hypothetical protein
MAIWRDPLDELIADLERAVPQPEKADWYIPPYEDFQFAIEPYLYGTEEDQKRSMDNLRVRAFWAWLEKQPPCTGPLKGGREPDTDGGDAGSEPT